VVDVDIDEPRGIVVDAAAGKIYWTDRDSTTISRADFDDGGLEVVVSGLDSPAGVALDVATGRVYWADYGSSVIGRATVDGRAVETVVADLDQPVALPIVPIPGGDANGDGKVNVQDLAMLATGWHAGEAGGPFPSLRRSRC